ncbi:Hypothetical_protein [Hexamita inflata]|uniref:Hypothetical_protein n=1 Tax=Hexamita inflata TaxID=28002 RepID=A0AA86Q4K4_9EUKA|nr:Hypothetical protein HINF_LOCUS33174 [Hexamita inflata]
MNLMVSDLYTVSNQAQLNFQYYLSIHNMILSSICIRGENQKIFTSHIDVHVYHILKEELLTDILPKFTCQKSNYKTYKLPSKEKRSQKIANRQLIYNTVPRFKPQTNKKQRKHNNTQLPYSTKGCYQQKDLQNKLNQPEKANGDSVRRFDV